MADQRDESDGDYVSDPPTGDEEEAAEFNPDGAVSDADDAQEFHDGRSAPASDAGSARSAGIDVAGIVSRVLRREAEEHAQELAASGGGAAAGGAAAGGSGGAPKGLPGLPSRPAPRGGLPFLPPRPAAQPPPQQQQQQQQQQRDEPRAAGGPAPPPRAAPAAAEAALAPPPGLPDAARRVRDRVQAFRVTVFRLALRCGAPTRSAMLQQLMYRLGIAERLHLGQAAAAPPGPAAEAAEAAAERAEVLAEPLDFEATVLVLGARGAGKTATIHRMLGLEPPAGYAPTGGVASLRGEVGGVPVTFIDTPGLEPGAGAAAANLARLRRARAAFRAARGGPPVLLYVDRGDAPRRDGADAGVVRAVTDVFGADAWFSTVLVLTHAGAAAPDGGAGAPLEAAAYAQQRAAQVQALLRGAAGDQRLMNPVAHVENRAPPGAAPGDGPRWRPSLAMLCFTTKVLNEANALLRPGDAAGGGGRGGGGGAPFQGMKIPPMGWLLSRLVEFRGPRKFPEDEREVAFDDALAELPPPERAAALRRRRLLVKQRAEEARAAEAEGVPVPAPEPQLPPSFDADVGGHRFRALEEPGGMLCRPIVGEGGVDHEDAVDSVHLERQGVLRPRGRHLGGAPALAFVQAQKDKNALTVQAEAEASVHPSSKVAATAQLNVQTIGRDVLYTQRLEARARVPGSGRHRKRNKVTAGAIVSKLGEDFSHPFKAGAVAYGAKLDDRLRLGPNAKLRGSLGRVWTRAGSQVDRGTAAAADLKLRPGGDPSSRLLLGGSAVWQRRDTTYAGNVAGEFRLPAAGRPGGKSETLVSANAGYNNKGSGNITVRLNSHDHPQLALSMLLPIARAAWERFAAKEEF